MSNGYRRPRMSAGLYLSEKTAPYVAPWLLSLGAMPVAVLIHFTLGSDARWMIILSAVCTLITIGTWFTWKVHKPETRLTATVFVGVLFGWVVFAGTGVPWRGDLLKSWVVGGFGLSVFWCIRHAGIVGGHDRDRTDKDEDSWLGKKVSAFKNSRTDKSSVKETEDELRWTTTLDAPTVAGDAQRSREQIAAVAGVGADQVKVLKVPGHEGQVETVLNRRQDNSKPLAYRGPSAPGQSIAAAPVWLGRRTDGSDIVWWIVGSNDPKNPRPLAHTKCTGVTGSGKTETVCTGILDMRWRTDVVPVVGDPAKFQQSFGDIEECLGLAAKTEAQCKQLIRNLSAAVVGYRSELLGSLERSDGGKGYKQWEPECYTLHGIPAVFVDIEEAADVALDTDIELDEAVRKLRSLGIHLCLSMQTMPHDNISRKTRGQFSQSLAHGQNEFQDAKYSLNGITLEAGADPTKWSNSSPGSLYAETVGTDKKHWPIDGRAVYMKPAEKRMSMDGSRQFWAVLDPGTYERLAFGLFDEEELPGLSDLDEYDDEEGTEDVSSRSAYAGVEGADPTVPLTPPGDRGGFAFEDDPPQVKMGVEEARARLQDRLRILEDSGQMRIKAKDLSDLPQEVGKTPGWLYENLYLLVAAGRLKEFRPPEGGVIFEILKRYPEAG